MRNNTMTRLLILINNKLFNKRFRFFVGIFSIINGFIRIKNTPDLTFTRLSFGNECLFGIILFIFGFALLLSTRDDLRLSWLGRISAVILSALYATIGLSIFPTNVVSATSSLLISLFLFTEIVIIP